MSVLAADNLTLRTTWFDNRVKDPVSNVTIGTNLQQRQNLGRTRIWGLQTDAEYRVATFWRFFGAYLYEEAKVTENETNPALVGKFLAQVPKHRGTAQVSYENPRFANVTFEVQAVGNQFDDDLNTRTVPGIEEPGLPKYGIRLFERIARAESSGGRVHRGAEPLRPGLLRRHAADADRAAAARERWTSTAPARPLTKKLEGRS